MCARVQRFGGLSKVRAITTKPEFEFSDKMCGKRSDISVILRSLCVKGLLARGKREI
jgi:hypothetical protein